MALRTLWGFFCFQYAFYKTSLYLMSDDALPANQRDYWLQDKK